MSQAGQNNAHQVNIMAEVVRLFRAFPSGKNVDEYTLHDYCEAFALYEKEIVRDVVDRFRLGNVTRRSHDFPPALAETMIELRKCARHHDLLARQQSADGTQAIRASEGPQYVLPPTHFLNRT